MWKFQEFGFIFKSYIYVHQYTIHIISTYINSTHVNLYYITSSNCQSANVVHMYTHTTHYPSTINQNLTNALQN